MDRWWEEIPRKREAADALLLDGAGRALIVQNAWNEAWTLPGGALEAGETPRRGAEREIEEELGLSAVMGRLLVVDWEPPTETLPIDGVMTMFDGGVLTSAQIAAIRLQEKEIAAFRFVTPDELPDGLPGILRRRLRMALSARESGATVYLENGYAPS
ncbi:MAG TPA: NUDIX hydrolase [Mycobacteriales bacterium]|nr:NUDIX hydrolase [Mycobacteriales bacterium]